MDENKGKIVLPVDFTIDDGVIYDVGSKSIEVYKKYIDYFSVFTSTSKIQMCMCSYKDKMVISFSSKFVNSEIEKNFFKFLSKDGTDVIINTNDYGDCDE